MKKIGLMGGLGPASTIEYYMELVNLTLEEYGSEFYPKIVINSVDLSEYTKHFNKCNYKKIGDLIYESLLTLNKRRSPDCSSNCKY